MLGLVFATLAAVTAPTVQAGSGPSPASSTRDFLVRNYPRPSLDRGEQGPVGFEVTIEPDGFMSGCAIEISSGFPELDRGTCEFLARYGKFKPVNDSNGNTVKAVHSGRINWRLPEGSVQPAVAKLAAAPERLALSCRRFDKIGTRTRKVKVCMTASEWNYQEQVVRDELTRGLKAPGVSR